MHDRRSPTWIALLRGVNVGRARPVAMADLRSLLERLRCTDLRTLLKVALHKKLGIDARVFVLAADSRAALLAAHPLRAREATWLARLAGAQGLR